VVFVHITDRNDVFCFKPFVVRFGAAVGTDERDVEPAVGRVAAEERARWGGW